MSAALFDPFHDFDSTGYLRNVRQDKDPETIKHVEHGLFCLNLERALAHLASRKTLSYDDFLRVHHLLFTDYYPWAGQDRAALLPDSAVSKGGVLFSHPYSARRAVEHTHFAWDRIKRP